MNPTRRPCGRNAPRALVLIAVMVVAGSALFIATGLTFLIQSETASSAGARDQAQSRAVARSGLYILLNAMEDQKEAILEGIPFDLQDEWIVFEAPGEIGVVRLLPVGPDGGVLVHENGRVDINSVISERLVASGLIPSTVADEIITFRDQRGKRVQSPLELLEIDSITSEMFFGPLDNLRVQSPIESRGDGTIGEAELRGLDDLLTVFSFEAMIRRDGEPRVVLSEESLAEHEADIMNRFPNARLERLTHLRNAAAADLKTEGDLLNQLLTSGMSIEDAAIVLDYFTIAPGRYRQGRIDINSAPYESLLTLEGITPETAAEIVRRRVTLDADIRWTPVWLVTEGIMTADEYIAVAEQVCARSWQFRVRLMAGLMTPEQEGDALRNAIVLEVVIDLAGESPRIAYLRDITLLETAAAVALGSEERASEDEFPFFDESQSESGPLADSMQGGGSGAQPDGESDGEWGFGDSDLDFGDTSESDSSASNGNRSSSSGSVPESEISPPPGPSRIGRWTGGG